MTEPLPSQPQPMTAEQLFQMPDSMFHELVRGELIVGRPGYLPQGAIASNFALQLGSHVLANDLGNVYAKTGFIVERNPDTVFGPSVSFVRKERLPSRSKEDFFLELAPDLAAEVISPDIPSSRVEQRARMWLTAGIGILLVIDTEVKIVRRYARLDRIDVFDQHANVDCSAAVPGWTLDTAELFEE